MKPGMKVKEMIITDGGEVRGNKWSKITEVVSGDSGYYFTDAGETLLDVQTCRIFVLLDAHSMESHLNPCIALSPMLKQK